MDDEYPTDEDEARLLERATAKLNGFARDDFDESKNALIDFVLDAAPDDVLAQAALVDQLIEEGE